MLRVDNNLGISMSLMETAQLKVSAKKQDGSAFKFAAGDVVRLKIFPGQRHRRIIFDTKVESECESVIISISDLGMRISELELTGNSPARSWEEYKPIELLYDITLNPYTDHIKLVGYDVTGPKMFRVFP